MTAACRLLAPLVLAALPLAVAAPLLRHAALRSLGQAPPMSAQIQTALLEAST